MKRNSNKARNRRNKIRARVKAVRLRTQLINPYLRTQNLKTINQFLVNTGGFVTDRNENCFIVDQEKFDNFNETSEVIEVDFDSHVRDLGK
jgi:hypothetical protein